MNCTGTACLMCVHVKDQCLSVCVQSWQHTQTSVLTQESSLTGDLLSLSVVCIVLQVRNTKYVETVVDTPVHHSPYQKTVLPSKIYSEKTKPKYFDTGVLRGVVVLMAMLLISMETVF